MPSVSRMSMHWFLLQVQTHEKKAVAPQGEPSKEIKALTCIALKQYCDNPALKKENLNSKINLSQISPIKPFLNSEVLRLENN